MPDWRENSSKSVIEISSPHAKIQLLLDEPSIQDQLIRILLEANHVFNYNDTLSGVDAALVLVESFIVSVEKSAELRQKVLSLLSANALAEPIRRFLDLNQEIQLQCTSYDHINVCPYLYTERLVMLRQKIGTLFLKTALFAQSDSMSLDVSLGSALLHTITALFTMKKCKRYSKNNNCRNNGLVALFEAGSTPLSFGESNHWRDRIKDDLAKNAEHQYQTIVRTMGVTCQDLERRCTEIERPLREEQAKSGQLHERLEESRLLIADLQSHNHEQSLYLEGVEHEKSELTERVKHLENERVDMSSLIERLHQALQETSHRAEEATKSNQDRIKELELVRAASIAEKDEELDALHFTEHELRTRMGELEADAVAIGERASVDKVEITRLETARTEQDTALHQAQATIYQKQAECDELAELADSLRVEKRDLQSQVGKPRTALKMKFLLIPSSCNPC